MVKRVTRDCPKRKGKLSKHIQTNKTTPQVNMATNGPSNNEYVFLNSQLFTIYEPNKWLVDTGTNVYLYADMTCFISYQATYDHSVTMRNESTTKVLGIGCVNLKFFLGCILSV